MMKHIYTFLVFLAAVFNTDAATYYIDYSSGSDANNGTSKATPWKRAPGMKGFTRSYQHTAGDRFIFKGGVTWPVGCFQMKITAGGSSDTNRDYYGADTTWFSGSAFKRPLFDFQHTLVGPGWTAAAGVLVESCSYVTFDNIELANHRSPLQIDGIVTWGSTAICLNSCSRFTLNNCLIRDWDMPTPILYGSSGGGGIMRVNGGGYNVVMRSQFHQQGVSVKSGTSIWNINTVAFSEVHHTATAIMSAQLVHNNYIHHLLDPTDTGAHSNVMLCNGGLRAYSNLIHDISPTAQVIFVAPGYYGYPAQDWIYNNVIYNVAQPCIAIDTDGQNDSGSGSHVFNNTLVGAYGTGHCIRVGYRANGDLPLLETRNNHYITSSAAILKDNPTRGGGYVTTFLDGPNVTHTPTQASAAGYVLSNAYQPVDSSKPTVNVGANLSTIFTTDIRDVPRGQLGAWDAGAYEFGGTSGGGTPGVLVQDAATRSVNETAGSVTLTVRRSGGSAGAVSCSYTTVNGTASAGVNYGAASGTLSWANGDAADKSITVTILNKATIGNKDFAVNLSNPAGGASLGSPSSTLVTIVGSGTTSGAGPTTPSLGIINPSFESGLTGWIASGNVDTTGLPYKATDGTQLAYFNSGQKTPNGILSQSFSTVAGQTYGLSFDVGVLAYNTSEQRMQVTVRGGGVLLSRTVSVFGIGGGASKWAPQSFTFVADSPTTTLAFQDVSPTSYSLDLLLDNVRLTSSAPPQSSAPTITTQPSSVTVAAGNPATFSVIAIGTGTLSYQWRFNGNVISGATGSSYTINNAQGSNAGVYSAVVSNSSGSVTSSGATLTVTTQSTGTTLVNGSFEADYTGWTQTGNQGIGTPPYIATDGTRLAVFNRGDKLPNAVLSQSFSTVAGQTYGLNFDMGVLSYNYNEQRLQVTVRGGGVLLSRTISLKGDAKGLCRWTPQSFSFVADGATTTLIFQDVSPSTASLDLLLDNVRITGSTAPQSPGPTITTQPSSVAVAAGSPATFSVVASGTGTLSYQWRFNGSAISGATASSYTISSAQAANAGTYTVVVSNSSGSVISSAATLSVTSQTANSFTNGSFEDQYAGWTQSGYQKIAATGKYPGADGAYLVCFNSGDMPANGIVSQTFATTAGKQYTLTFNVGVLAYNYNEQRMQATVQGAGSLLNRTVSVTGLGGGKTRWAPQSFTFVADSASSTLTFRDISPSTAALDLLLDKVTVVTGN